MVDGDFDRLWVTIKLEVAYRRPTPTNVPLTVEGWIERDDTRRSLAAAEITLPDGEVTARCEAVIARPPEGLLSGWLEERRHWRVERPAPPIAEALTAG